MDAIDRLTFEELGALAAASKTKAQLREEEKCDQQALRTMRRFMTAENFEKHELYFELHPDESPDDFLWDLFEESTKRINAELGTAAAAGC